jgi:protein TonB
MSLPSRTIYLLAAVGLHAAVLWGVNFGPPAFIASEEDPGEVVEVALVESVEQVAEPTPEPPAPEPIPPMPPEPPAPIPPDAIPDSAPAPEPPKPTPLPQPKSKPKPAPRPVAALATTGAMTGTTSGNPGAAAGKPARGDSAHATWRNRVRPAYPAAARAAGQAGRVLIVVNVNALGNPAGARISSSSGFPSLDQAALSAARSSTYNPRRIAGIPLPDTISVPYTFRLDDR